MRFLYTPVCNMGATSHEGFKYGFIPCDGVTQYLIFFIGDRCVNSLYTPVCNMGATSHEVFEYGFISS